jgi:hemerythrin-like metal-binding protein
MHKKDSVFIVEDDGGLLHLIKKKLNRFGYQVEGTTNADFAIKEIANRKPCLLLLDYQLGKITGLDLIHTLRNNKHLPPFIIMTGNGNEEVAVSMMKLGAKDYLIKDASFLDLLPRAIEKTIKHIKTEQKLASAEKDKKKLEIQLRQSQKMDAIGQLTGGIAHDFNNILGIILGNLELIKYQKFKEEPIRNRLNIIEQSAKRAAELTKQLLGFSRSKNVDPNITNINHLINTMDSLIDGSVTPKITVLYEYAEDLWLTQIDPGDFQDALLNLIINARDSMLDGGKITVETSNKIFDADYCKHNQGAKLGNYVQLTVSDNGVGIPPEYQEKVFNPFFTTKEQGKGTGLGLAMVYAFVKRSGGYINLYSEQGIGTAFRIYLPQIEGKEQNKRKQVVQSQELPQGNETILVVDDEEDLRELAENSLQMLGYRVQTAENGLQALDIIAKNSEIDLLFSDVVMPGGINGYELAEKVTTDHPQVKILLSSGYTKKAVLEKDHTRRNFKLLNKPYSQIELAKQLRTILDEPKISNPSLEKQFQQLESGSISEHQNVMNMGIKVLDDEHQVLEEMLRDCRQIIANNNKGKCDALLKQLQNYAIKHFKTEEIIMQACDYPELNNHKQVHQLLLKQIKKMQFKHNQGDLNIEEIIIFLESWLVDHIQIMDQSVLSFCEGKDEQMKQTLRSMTESL